ncbi:MAG: tripartite tricarboxylate transporter substrate binding protein, partial [Burkholderiales bacterium]
MRVRCAALAVLAAQAVGAAAQNYPVRPLRIIVPQSAGGSTDLVARPLAQKLAEALGQTVVVDNRPGAGSVIGTDLVAKAAPDGYTLLAVAASLTMSPSLYKLPFDPVRDLAGITQLTSLPNILVVHPALPVTSTREFIAYAKARPGQLNFGSSGIATGTHLSMELLMYMTGIRLTHVPYKGGSLNVNALIGGETQANFSTISTALPHVKSGRLRALAVSTSKRSPAAPEVPTIAEGGVAGYDYTSWIGLLAPAGTPPAVIARLNTESVKAVHSPEMKSILAAEASDPVGNSPQQFEAMVKTEVARWQKVVKAAGIK